MIECLRGKRNVECNGISIGRSSAIWNRKAAPEGALYGSGSPCVHTSPEYHIGKGLKVPHRLHVIKNPNILGLSWTLAALPSGS